MRFDAIAFDLDGTLYPTMAIYAIAFPKMLENLGRLVAFNATRRAIRALGENEAYRRLEPHDGTSFRKLQAEMTAARIGIEPRAAAIMIDRVFYSSVQELFSRVRPFRGLEPALDRISKGGLRLALLSDLPPARKLELLGLAGRFEPALCSEDSGFLKPAPEPFVMLASRLGLEPERILYVGNSPRIDVAGAKRAGMSAAVISPRRVEGADLSFVNWDKLADFALS